MWEVECKRCGKPVKYELGGKTTKIGTDFVCGLAWVFKYNKKQIDLCPDCLAEFKAWYESGPVVKERMNQKEVFKMQAYKCDRCGGLYEKRP